MSSPLLRQGIGAGRGGIDLPLKPLVLLMLVLLRLTLYIPGCRLLWLVKLLVWMGLGLLLLLLSMNLLVQALTLRLIVRLLQPLIVLQHLAPSLPSTPREPFPLSPNLPVPPFQGCVGNGNWLLHFVIVRPDKRAERSSPADQLAIKLLGQPERQTGQLVSNQGFSANGRLTWKL